MSFCYKSDLRCASLSAHESGIFELLRQLYPARLLFFAVEKKDENANNLSVDAARRRHRRSQRIKGNKRRLRTKRLRQATHDLYGTSIPPDSLWLKFKHHPQHLSQRARA